MIGLPLAPSYLPGIPTPQQQTVLAAVPPIRQQLNRYRYAALKNSVLFFGNLVASIIFFFAIYKFLCVEKHMNDRNIGE
jgi:hypothetical protein